MSDFTGLRHVGAIGNNSNSNATGAATAAATSRTSSRATAAGAAASHRNDGTDTTGTWRVGNAAKTDANGGTETISNNNSKQQQL